MPPTIPHGSIGPRNTPIAAGSALVELFDSSDSIDDLLLMFTLAGGRLKEALRSGKQEKKNVKKFAQPTVTLIVCGCGY